MKLLRLAVFVSILVFAATAHASMTLGTVDPNSDGNYKALILNDSLGNSNTLNFGKYSTSSSQNITISDTELRGFAWGEGVGWIVMNCLDTSNGCVLANDSFKIVNDGSGNLSGYAWGENTGWVNFGPFTNTSISTVKITDGEFGGTLGDAGYAWAENFGWIKFDCSSSDSCVETDWGVEENQGGGGSSGSIPICAIFPWMCPSTTPTCATNPSLCPPAETCATNPSLCVPPPNACVINPNSCVPPPTYCELNPSLCVPPSYPVDPTPTQPPISECNVGDIDCPLTTTPDCNLNPELCVPPQNTCQNDPSLCTPVPTYCSTHPEECVPMPGPSKVEVIKNNILSIIKNIIKDVTTPGGIAILAGAVFVVTLAVSSIALVEVPVLLTRIWYSLKYLFGWRKKEIVWGIIYNSLTKEPINLASATLYKESGEKVLKTITYKDGRYGFNVPAGVYRVDVTKNKFSYPSQNIPESIEKEIHTNLHFGGSIIVDNSGSVTKNIPVDPITD